MGVQLQPGAVPALLGLPAAEIAGRHLSLSELWGRDGERLRERLAEAPESERLDLFETFLVGRLCEGHLDPMVRFALAFFEESEDVGAAARRTGYSHRHSIEELSPEEMQRRYEEMG